MDAAVVTVGLAVVGALSWLAYYHPVPFRVFSLVTKVGAMLGIAGLAGFQLGAVSMERAVLDALPAVSDPLAGPKLHDAVAAVRAPILWMAILVLLNVYVIILDYLPALGIVPRDR